MRVSPYALLDRPWVYRLSQSLLAPGSGFLIRRRVRRLLERLPPAKRLLDVGCGPESRLFALGLRPVGADPNPAYIDAYRRRGAEAVLASALALPFADGRFDGVWSFTVLHHLSDAEARAAVAEMLRVCRLGGYVALADGVLPRSPWARAPAWLTRRLDRGAFMRTEEQLLGLLPDRDRWRSERYSYSVTLLEMVHCWRIKD